MLPERRRVERLDRDAPSLRAVVNGVAAGAGDVPDFAPYASWYGQMAPPVGVLDAFVSIHGVPLDRVAVRDGGDGDGAYAEDVHPPARAP